jgi:hypothetical protein
LKAHSIDDLRWIRVFTPVHIPKYLVDQVRDRDYSVEDFYKYQETACIRMTKEGPTLNPLNHLWVLVDQENITKGFVWFTINSLSKDIYINTFSMNKDYWYKGKAVEKLANFIKEIKKKAKLNKVLWTTNYPKHSLRHGFIRSKSTLMEYTGEEENGSDSFRRSNTRGEHRSPESSTTTISRGDLGSTRDRATSRASLQSVFTTV